MAVTFKLADNAKYIVLRSLWNEHKRIGTDESDQLSLYQKLVWEWVYDDDDTDGQCPRCSKCVELGGDPELTSDVIINLDWALGEGYTPLELPGYLVEDCNVPRADASKLVSQYLDMVCEEDDEGEDDDWADIEWDDGLDWGDDECEGEYHDEELSPSTILC